jgi:N-formylglutamate deformylase
MPYCEPGLFVRHDPLGEPVPVLVEVSRSGREYPVDYRCALPFNTVHDNVSGYVEELWQSSPRYGASLLVASFPNTYIDANRAEDDLDPALLAEPWPTPLTPSPTSLRGLGLIKSLSRWGEPFQDHLLTVEEVEHRLATYHRPYHAELARIVSAMRAQSDQVYVLSCHCMSAVGAPTHPDAGQPRADICLGDVNGTTSSPEFIDFVQDAFKDLGLSVTRNTPYTGGYLNRRHGDVANGIHSIMVEVNKALFMDTKTFRKTEGFANARKAIDTVISRVAALAREGAQ